MPTLIRLFTDLTVYKELVVGKLSTTFLRYSLAYLLIALGFSVWINGQYSAQVYSVIDAVTNQIQTTIPESATFELKDGTLIATATTSSTYLSIDSSADATTLASSAAFLALGKTHFRITTDVNGAHEIRSYQDEGWQNLTVSGKEMRTNNEALKKSSTMIKPYLPLVLMFPTFFFYCIARLIHTLFYALLLRIFGSSINRVYRFTHYWKLTLSTVIVADTINLLVLFAYHQSYSLVFTLAFFGTTLLAYLNLPAYPNTSKN